jgi:hypothetical protein
MLQLSVVMWIDTVIIMDTEMRRCRRSLRSFPDVMQTGHGQKKLSMEKITLDILSTLANIEYVILHRHLSRIGLYGLTNPVRLVRYKFKADANTAILTEYGDASVYQND